MTRRAGAPSYLLLPQERPHGFIPALSGLPVRTGTIAKRRSHSLEVSRPAGPECLASALEENGGDDETRTGDLCRDGAITSSTYSLQGCWDRQVLDNTHKSGKSRVSLRVRKVLNFAPDRKPAAPGREEVSRSHTAAARSLTSERLNVAAEIYPKLSKPVFCA
jgi:hypothetical protein